MAVWPATAHLLAAEDEMGGELPAERTDLPGVPRQVDRATTSVRQRRLRWWMRTHADAHAWIAWAARQAHGECEVGVLRGRWRHVRIVDGLGGVVLKCEVVAGRPQWVGAAVFEVAA